MRRLFSTVLSRGRLTLLVIGAIVGSILLALPFFVWMTIDGWVIRLRLRRSRPSSEAGFVVVACSVDKHPSIRESLPDDWSSGLRLKVQLVDIADESTGRQIEHVVWRRWGRDKIPRRWGVVLVPRWGSVRTWRLEWPAGDRHPKSLDGIRREIETHLRPL